MNKENSPLKTQDVHGEQRTLSVEWHTESKLEESKCHHHIPDGLELSQ